MDVVELFFLLILFFFVDVFAGGELQTSENKSWAVLFDNMTKDAAV